MLCSRQFFLFMRNYKNYLFKQSELEVNAQTRRMQLLEEEMQRVTERLTEVLDKLESAEKAAGESEQGRKMIEGRLSFVKSLIWLFL